MRPDNSGELGPFASSQQSFVATPKTHDMGSLGLREAAGFLRMHPSTLQARAKAGEIPGAKVGKCWVFLEVDLAEYVRSISKAGNGKGYINRLLQN